MKSLFFGDSQAHNVVDEDTEVEFASLSNDIEAYLWLAAMRTRIESGSLPQADARIGEA